MCFPTLCYGHQCSCPPFSASDSGLPQHWPSPTPGGLSASSNTLSFLHFNHSPPNLHLCTWPQASHFHARETLLCFVPPVLIMVSGVPSKGCLPRAASLTSLMHSFSLCAHCSVIFLFFPLILLLVSFYWNMSFHVKVLAPHCSVSSN